MIFYQTKEKIYHEQSYPNIYDPTSPEGKGLYLVVSQKSLAMFWLSFFPLEPKTAYFFSNSTELAIPKKQWTPKMQTLAQDVRRQAKGGWKLWTLSFILVSIFLSAYVIANYAENRREANLAYQLDLRTNPKEGDILHLMYLDPATSWTAASARIARITEDSLFIKISEQRVPVVQFDHATAKKKLDTSENKYTIEKAIVAKPYKERRILFYDRSYELVLPSCDLKLVEREK